MNEKYYQKKIALIIVLFSFIPVLLFASFFYRQTYNERIEHDLKGNETQMHIKFGILEDDLVYKSQLINELAESIEVKVASEGISEGEFLKKIQKQNPDFDLLKVLSPREFCDLFQLEWDGIALTKQGVPFYQLDEDNYFYIAYPIYENRHERRFLVGKISVEHTVNWFKELAPNTSILAFSNDKEFFRSSVLANVGPSQIKQIGEDVSLVRVTDKKIYIAFKKYLPAYSATFYVFKENSSFDVYRTLYRDYILKIMVMILVSTLVTYFISLRINYPFNNIKKVAKRIIDGDYEAKIENVEDELLNLNLSFNKMADLHREKNEEFLQYAMTMLEKNEHLSDLNNQLENSYDQLKAITEMLEYSRDKYQALFDHIKEFIWVIDQTGSITYVNAVVCEKLGYKEDELLKGHFFDFFVRFDEEELAPKEELVDQFLRRDYSNLSFWIKSKENDEILVSANSKRVFKNGVLQGAQATARTIEFEELLHNRVLRKNREFEIIKEINWSLANSLTLQSLLENVVQKVNELFTPEINTIRIMDGDQLVFKAGSGRLEKYARTDNYSIHDDFSGVAVKENRVLRVRDFENTIFYNRASLSDLLEEVAEIIVIPLENNGVIHGTISIGLREAMKDVDIKLLKTLTVQASIGIEKMKLYDQLKIDYLNTIRVLATAVEAKDKYTEGHSFRVSMIAKRLGQELGFQEQQLEEIEIAGMLHDIGKIGIDDEILTKKGGLTEEEYLIMKSHPTIGKKILDPIGLSEKIIQGVYLHHKRYDLKGYPKDEQLEKLMLYPAIIGVADALDAMTSNRTYSKEKSIADAMSEIRKFAGSQFAPLVVEALERIIEEDKSSLQAIMR